MSLSESPEWPVEPSADSSASPFSPLRLELVDETLRSSLPT